MPQATLMSSQKVGVFLDLVQKYFYLGKVFTCVDPLITDEVLQQTSEASTRHPQFTKFNFLYGFVSRVQRFLSNLGLSLMVFWKKFQKCILKHLSLRVYAVYHTVVSPFTCLFLKGTDWWNLLEIFASKWHKRVKLLSNLFLKILYGFSCTTFSNSVFVSFYYNSSQGKIYYWQRKSHHLLAHCPESCIYSQPYQRTLIQLLKTVPYSWVGYSRPDQKGKKIQ